VAEVLIGTVEEAYYRGFQGADQASGQHGQGFYGGRRPVRWPASWTGCTSGKRAGGGLGRWKRRCPPAKPEPRLEPRARADRPWRPGRSMPASGKKTTLARPCGPSGARTTPPRWAPEPSQISLRDSSDSKTSFCTPPQRLAKDSGGLVP
jgi:hypothetical protein